MKRAYQVVLPTGYDCEILTWLELEDAVNWIKVHLRELEMDDEISVCAVMLTDEQVQEILNAPESGRG